MTSPAEQLRIFFEKIKTVGFFQRLFGWAKIRSALVDAAAALGQLISEKEHHQQQLQGQQQELAGLRKDLQLAQQRQAYVEQESQLLHDRMKEKDAKISELQKELHIAHTNNNNNRLRLQEMEKELIGHKEIVHHLREENKRLSGENIRLVQEEESRRQAQEKSINTFEKWRAEIQADRNRELEERQQAEREKMLRMKQTWNEHETLVKQRMKTLCQKLTVTYADAVPFRGTPDNTIMLCNEHIVFDAKSPASDDLSNFPQYLKTQAENAKKYAKQDGVRNDIFFVVPSNTLEVVKQTHFAFGDYNVYIVSLDVLEPLLLCLQKVETYEFAEQLTPEERENICRIIGRFTHLTKRRIQIDSFFARQFMEIIYKCDGDLPDDIKKDVASFEKAEKLNPPADRRTKIIDSKELQKDAQQLELEIGTRGIATEDLSTKLNGVKLYKEEE